MTLKKIRLEEGEISFEIPGIEKECKTWYQIYGDLSSGVTPLIALHGGPGVGHNYLLSLRDLTAKYNIPLILYDQIGCGKSTHLQEKKGDEEFWTVQLFLFELSNLIKHFHLTTYDLYGNSWGGMLAAEHAILKPPGLRRLIIADSPASMVDWVISANKLRKELPKAIQDTLTKHEKDGTTDSDDYQEAMGYYYSLHVCRLKQPWPKDISDTFQNIEDDNTVYLTMNGPSEFFVTGNLRDWDIKEKLGEIDVTTLLINGIYDEATDEVMEPFFETIEGRVRWIQFGKSSHMPHWEERERFMRAVYRFLT